MDTLAYNENGRRIIVSPINNGRQLKFSVYKIGQPHPYWSISRWYDPDIDIEDLDYYRPTIESIIKNIVPIDPDNLEDYHGFTDYGVSNGWSKGSKFPLIEKANKDKKNNPWICIYQVDIELHRCYHRVINYTYKYTYVYDSSD